ncbi:MAG TPA: DUF3667 domain-containing protein [Bacteroidia bacterium]|nr:DUF3667 domain-containing protein [Bacteroidia bacterium]
MVEGNYCPQCAQAAKTGRITWKSFLSEGFKTLTHAEKSIFGTSWQLLIRPGKVLDEYLSGKRKKYQSPVSFFLVWVTITILVHRMILAHSGFHPVFMEGLTFKHPESIKLFITHGEWLYLLTFPVSAAIFYFMLGRPLYTYIESIVVTMYAFSEVYLFYVLCYLIGGGLFSLNVLHWGFYLFQIIISLAYSLWTLIDLFSTKGIRYLWLRVIVYLILNLIIVLRFLEFLSDLWVNLESSGSV